MLPMADNVREVYLPLSVTQGDSGEARGVYRLLVLAGVELEELYRSIDRVDEQGKLLQRIQGREPLGYGFYPLNRGIPIDLPSLPSTGF